jgi:hypothetical protein
MNHNPFVESRGNMQSLEGEPSRKTVSHKKQTDYTVKGGKITFNPVVRRQHELFAKTHRHYLNDAKWSSWLTTPVILSCIIPVVLLDVWSSLYQAVCFPAYGIPKVKRSDYIIFDRNQLRYLNSIERLNCAYCGYVNGTIAYAQEIAGRTEQYWCPIKHAWRLKTAHSRYGHFLEYGDAKQYRQQVEQVRHEFGDIKSK